MAHRRTPSLLQVMHSTTTTTTKDEESPVLSATGVGIAAVVAAAATVLSPVASALPSMRSSMSLDSDDDSMSMSSLDLLMPPSPGTPSKLVPHPPRFQTAPSSTSRSSLAKAQLSLRRFVSRLIATLSSSAPGLPLKSPHLSPSSSHSFNLSSLPTRVHVPVRRRATFLALLTLIALCAWTLFTTSLAERETSAHAYSDGVLRGWKDWRNKAQHREAEERRRLLSSASFRAAVLSASSDASSLSNTGPARRPHPPSSNSNSPSNANAVTLTLTPADELAALTAFMAALPWNALPPNVDPSLPLDPTIILDFDPSHPRARDELAALRRETWQLNPVVLFGKARHAGTREVRAALEKLGVVDEEVMQFELGERVDGTVVMGVLERLVSSFDTSPDSDAEKPAQLDLPLLLIGGRPIRAADFPALAEGWELERLLREVGVRMVVGGKKKKGH